MGPAAWFSMKLNTGGYLKKPETFFPPSRETPILRVNFRFSFFSGMTRFLLCYDSARAAYLFHINSQRAIGCRRGCLAVSSAAILKSTFEVGDAEGRAVFYKYG